MKKLLCLFSFLMVHFWCNAMEDQQPTRTHYPQPSGTIQRILFAKDLNANTLIWIYNNGQELFSAEEETEADYDQDAVVTAKQLIMRCNGLDHSDQVKQLANTKPVTNFSETWRYWYPLKSLLHSAALKISLNYVRPFYDSEEFKIFNLSANNDFLACLQHAHSAGKTNYRVHVLKLNENNGILSSNCFYISEKDQNKIKEKNSNMLFTHLEVDDEGQEVLLLNKVQHEGVEYINDWDFKIYDNKLQLHVSGEGIRLLNHPIFSGHQ